MSKLQWEMKSKVGSLYLVATDKALLGIFWQKQKVPVAQSLKHPGAGVLHKTVLQLSEYFSGQRRDFDLPLAAEGTEFQQRVWNELKRIPYGQTLSYRDVARRLKNDKAFRAVGTANGRNPLSIIVPCHRVIAADGTLGGYAGGLKVKTELLKLEGLAVSSRAALP